MLDTNKQKNVILATGVFMLTALLAVIINSINGHGFNLTYTISKYVGFETWSAVLFCLGNIFVVAAVAAFLYSVGRAWRLPMWFYWMVVVMAVALLGASIFPSGYFNERGLGLLPTRTHEFCARIMFLNMLLIAVTFVLCKKASLGTRKMFALFAIYGAIAMVGYLTGAEWFTRLSLIFESAYLLCFLLALTGMRGADEPKRRLKMVNVKRKKGGDD